MKKKSILFRVTVFVPALLVIAGISELLLGYLLRVCQTQREINLCGILVNLLYGAAIGFLAVSRAKRETEEWKISLPRLFLLLLPMLLISAFFICYPFNRLELIDTMGMPYLNFSELYYGERPAAHLAYLFTGFFLLFLFAKSRDSGRKESWAKYICYSAAVVLLLLAVSLVTEKILAYAMDHLTMQYAVYEIFVLVTNIIFGIILYLPIYIIDPDFSSTISVKHARDVVPLLICVAMSCIPFIFIVISEHTYFKVPYNNVYYTYLKFFRQSDFLQTFQLLIGFLVTPFMIKRFSRENQDNIA